MMKISIITPTNNPKFLRELEETILAQTYQNWEWIVLLNQGAKWEPSNVPTTLRTVVTGGEDEKDCFSRQSGIAMTEDRIKIVECPFVNDSVGFLKRLACMNVTGEVTAEVDHDDLLTPDCLEKLAKAFEDEEVGFVFSKNAKLSKDFRPYMEEYGWTHDFFRWKGRTLYAMNNQPVYPGRLGHIYFAPDHIRAWRTSVYESIGGHDDTLKVCDDLDLMHRLYKVTKFKEIPEVLYIYRINGDNTFIQRGKLIREINEKLYDQNVEGLARRWAEINGLLVVDLGDCFSRQSGIAMTETKEGLLAMTDSSVGLVVAKDCLQYAEDPRGLMEEIHRVLAPGGMLISETLSTDGRGAFQDPEAKSFWNENSFLYYTKEAWARRLPATGNRRPAIFRECRLATVFKDDFGKEHRMPYVVAHLEKLNTNK